MSASSFTDWQIMCDAEDCLRQVWASEIDAADQTAGGLRKVLKARGWTVNVKTWRGIHQHRHLDFCPRHSPDLTVRVRAALEDGGWAEFSIRAEGGKVILDAPGDPCSWRTLVTGQCAGYLNEAGFTVEINGDSIELTPEASQ
jgi:hypothetical protein